MPEPLENMWRRPTLLLWALLLWGPAGTDWVEIPLHRKPPGAGSAGPTTTARPLVVGHSQLLAHLSVDRAATATIRRWQPISDLLDYGETSWSVDRGAADGYRPGANVTVSGKVEPWQPGDEQDDEYDVQEGDGEDEQEEQEADEEKEDVEEPVQTQLLPFGNRYEEESIESATAAGYSPGGHLERPAAEHFDDFDDYDEQPQRRPQPGPVAEDERHGGGSSKLTHERRKPLQMPSQFGGFVDFLRRMQANFVVRTAQTIGDKIRTLTGLRDQLLGSIERRIAALWAVPDRLWQRQRGRRRVKRGWMEPHAGADAMDFPSAEGALLTISFLTFAVFLIKLVLQVINTIKAKHYTYSTFAAATPVSGGVLVKRVRRHATPDAAILSAINSYKFS